MYICQTLKQTNKMKLLRVENIDFESNFMEVLFDGILKEGFYVESNFDFEEEVIEAEEDLNIQRSIQPTNISFWDFKIFNSEKDLITINDRETKKIKELVEFKLIDLLTEELND